MTEEFLNTSFDMLALEASKQPSTLLDYGNSTLTADIVSRIQEDIDRIVAELETSPPPEAQALDDHDLKQVKPPAALPQQPAVAPPPRPMLLSRPAVSPRRRVCSQSALSRAEDTNSWPVAGDSDNTDRSHTLPHSYRHSGSKLPGKHPTSPATGRVQQAPSTGNGATRSVPQTQLNTLTTLSRSADGLNRIPLPPVRMQDHGNNLTSGTKASATSRSSPERSPHKNAISNSSLTISSTSSQQEVPMRHRTNTLPTPHSNASNSTSDIPNSGRQCMSVIVNAGSLASITEGNEVPASSQEISLSDYATRNSAHFPKRVQVCKGFCSASDEVTISRGEVFDLHFVKHSKVLSIHDSTGIEYVLPLSSAVRLSILYDPFNSDRLAIAGFQYRTAGDIMALKKLPVVIAAQQSYDTGSQETSVESGEVLVVTGVKSSLRGRMLKVSSIRHGSKLLSEKCAGNFTTKSPHTSMSLSVIFQTSVSFPQKAVLTGFSKSSAQLVPSHLVKTPVILKQFRVLSSVIATCPLIQTPSDEQYAIEIPLGIDMEVKQCAISEIEKEKIERNTQNLSKHFDPTKVQPYFNMPSTESHQVQCMFLRDLCKENRLFGIQLSQPDLNAQLPSTEEHNSSTNTPTQNGHPNSVSTEDSNADNGLDVETRLRQVEMRCETLERALKEMSENYAKFSSKFDKVCNSSAKNWEQ